MSSSSTPLVDFFNHLRYNSQTIDLGFGNLRHLTEFTKELIKDLKVELIRVDNYPEIGAWSLPTLRKIIISGQFLNESPDILEAVVLHELGHVLNPYEKVHTRIDKFVVEQGFGAELNEALKIYAYINNTFLKDLPSIRYRRRRIRGALKKWDS